MDEITAGGQPRKKKNTHKINNAPSKERVSRWLRPFQKLVSLLMGLSVADGEGGRRGGGCDVFFLFVAPSSSRPRRKATSPPRARLPRPATRPWNPPPSTLSHFCGSSHHDRPTHEAREAAVGVDRAGGLPGGTHGTRRPPPPETPSPPPLHDSLVLSTL